MGLSCVIVVMGPTAVQCRARLFNVKPASVQLFSACVQL
ncbi:hypothetical protein RK21_03162 [Pseudomonas plecoglossicida]|nr:hypothetical protein RK21_03162 [Pseudomonas plecoglossicida]